MDEKNRHEPGPALPTQQEVAHLKGLVGFAAAIVGLVLAVVVVPRYLPVTAALEPVGFYHVGNNASDWAALPIQYSDRDACGTCHQDKSTVLSSARHAGLNCQTCHGAGTAHLEQGAKPVVDISRAACAVCHDKVTGRPEGFPQISIASHSGQAPCVTCHNPHDPRPPSGIKTSSIPKFPHQAGGWDDCLACHRPGSIRPVSAAHAERSNQSCLQCHVSTGV
ncbi:MAG: cytochrome c3 family protein [Chloroflexota bacterium]